MSFWEWYVTAGACAGFGAMGGILVLFGYAIASAAAKQAPKQDEEPIPIRHRRRHR